MTLHRFIKNILRCIALLSIPLILPPFNGHGIVTAKADLTSVYTAPIILGQLPDTIPPTVDSVTISNAGTIVATSTVTFSVGASDQGGSGVGFILVRDYTFDITNTTLLTGSWVIDAASRWLPYTSGTTYTWQLSASPGAHYLQIWAADRAGNISLQPLQDVVSYQPVQASVAQNDVFLYRIRPLKGSNVNVQMNVLTGNPDLYVWNFDGRPIANAGSDATIETASFVSDGRPYQIEVEGYVAGDFTLSISGLATHQVGLDATPAGRPRGTAITSVSEKPGANSATLPPPMTHMVLLPVVVR